MFQLKEDKAAVDTELSSKYVPKLPGALEMFADMCPAQNGYFPWKLPPPHIGAFLP